MYTYKFVDIKHSIWTGTPKRSIEDIVATHAAEGWRLVQVLQDVAKIMYRGTCRTKVIFERPIRDGEAYEGAGLKAEAHEFV
ncbi:MAG: DUF4177 domain-containing protein [Bacteroidota bacterium]